MENSVRQLPESENILLSRAFDSEVFVENRARCDINAVPVGYQCAARIGRELSNNTHCKRCAGVVGRQPSRVGPTSGNDERDAFEAIGKHLKRLNSR